jgi:hypothetical protein
MRVWKIAQNWAQPIFSQNSYITLNVEKTAQSKNLPKRRKFAQSGHPALKDLHDENRFSEIFLYNIFRAKEIVRKWTFILLPSFVVFLLFCFWRNFETDLRCLETIFICIHTEMRTRKQQEQGGQMSLLNNHPKNFAQPVFFV